MKSFPIRSSIIILLIFVSTVSIAQETDSLVLLLTNKSELRIAGTSNINKFNCRLQQDFEQDTLHIVTKSINKELVFNHAKLRFFVSDFNCGHRPINKDFQEAMQAENFPTISLSVQKLHSTDSFKFENKYADIRADIALELAGISRSYQIGFERIEIESKKLSFVGQKEVRMSDFQIDPPKALMGIIKANDDLVIHFNFELLLIKRQNSQSLGSKD